MTAVQSIDPRTGAVRAVIGQETTVTELDEVCERANQAFAHLRTRDRSWRADLLRTIASEIEARREELVTVADGETALGAPRLHGELTRSCFQLRMFADVVEEGAYLEAIVDHAAETEMGPRPDLRRMLVPLGPVAVFGASNFPFAFSVMGGDTASALAVGCPVVAKAHESHPETSQLSCEVMRNAATACGAPDGTIAVVHGREAGGALVQHKSITAVGFTGSVTGGRALMRLIDQRPEPIPFYGELGSINPLVVTELAAEQRATEIGEGLAASVMLGVGQFCTKPGLAFIPQGEHGDSLVAAAAAAVVAGSPGVLLNANISTSFTTGVDTLLAQPGVQEVATSQTPVARLDAVAVRLLEVPVAELGGAVLEECFGPVTVVVRYDDESTLLDALRKLPSSLTATIHMGSDELVSHELVDTLTTRAGRVVFNGFPTGVAVSWAMTHGGGWPASNSLHTSVGATAVRRFMRPMTWQSAPAHHLPLELREERSADAVPTRVDGVLRLP